MWQGDKIRYLRQLADSGIHMPETLIVREGEAVPDFQDLMEEEWECDRLVMKPAHGNGGWGVKMIHDDNMEEMADKMAEYLQEEDMMVQCFQNSIVDGPGEISVYIIAGQVTHATASLPADHNFLIHECYGGHSEVYAPNDKETAFAQQVAAAVRANAGVEPLYMRVDMFYDNEGELALMEIASGTTDCRFRHYPPAALVMAQGIKDFLATKEARYEKLFGKPVPPLMTENDFGALFGRYNKETNQTWHVGTESMGAPTADDRSEL